MSATRIQVRRGTYHDSIVLMQLRSALTDLPGVEEAGVLMGTPANKALLAQSQMLVEAAVDALPDDLIIVVRAGDDSQAEAALAQVDALLVRRGAASESAYRPRTLAAAARMAPAARWVLVSVPGRHAAQVAREALALGKNVFLYSDNVSVEDEVALKNEAAERGLLLLGPDCGTTLVAGVGLGFANRVRRGPIGLVAASGTGLQAVSARIHQLGSGVSQALGTGGRDLSAAVGGRTARQALALLASDPATRVIVLVSKPPAPAVAEELLAQARQCGKPVVVNFVGHPARTRRVGPLHLAATFDEAAEIAVRLAGAEAAPPPPPFSPGQRFLRGLFSGGTLAYEAQLLLVGYLGPLFSNVPLDPPQRLPNVWESRAHTIVDLGEDEFTVGRLHPMMDNELRLRRLRQEAADPEVAAILLDVVLGVGAHPDPASELAPAIREARASAQQAGRYLEVVAAVIGTDEDPQGLDEQTQALRAAGATVFTSSAAAAHHAGQLLLSLTAAPSLPQATAAPALEEPLRALNVGLALFAESLTAQGAEALHVEWRPPAGGNERLAGLLAAMRG